MIPASFPVIRHPRLIRKLAEDSTLFYPTSGGRSIANLQDIIAYFQDFSGRKQKTPVAGVLQMDLD